MRELTNAQKEYFKNSQFRDSDGNLIPCYHITNVDFDAFDKTKINQEHAAFYGQGFYFSTNDKYDESFGEQYKGCFGDIKHECYINMKNPLVIDDIDYMEVLDIMEYMRDNHPDYGKPDGPTLIAIDQSEYPAEYSDEYKLIPEAFKSDIFSYGAWKEYAKQLTDYAKENGYDGIIQKPLSVGEKIEVVVFEPNQIKLTSNLYPTHSDHFKDNSQEYFQNQKHSFDDKVKEAKKLKELQNTNLSHRKGEKAKGEDCI